QCQPPHVRCRDLQLLTLQIVPELPADRNHDGHGQKGLGDRPTPTAPPCIHPVYCMGRRSLLQFTGVRTPMGPMACDYVFAHPTTVTGSIGVIRSLYDASGL